MLFKRRVIDENDIITERRNLLYKNKITDHIQKVYGINCYLKNQTVRINKKSFYPIYKDEIHFIGLINESTCRLYIILKEDYSIKDETFIGKKLKFI